MKHVLALVLMMGNSNSENDAVRSRSLSLKCLISSLGFRFHCLKKWTLERKSRVQAGLSREATESLLELIDRNFVQ